MTRRRFVQIKGELIEVSADYIPPLRSITDAVLWNDRAYQDMNDTRFKSRTQHREYMNSRGLALTEDFKGEWKQKEKERIGIRQGVDPTRKRDIERAISQLNSRRK